MSDCVHIRQPSHVDDRNFKRATMTYSQCQFCGEVRYRKGVIDRVVRADDVPSKYHLPFQNS